MTVGELIERLKAFPPDMTVVRSDSEWNWFNIDDVREDNLITFGFGTAKKEEETAVFVI